MSKAVRPTIEVLREYGGTASREDFFISLLVDRVKESLSSDGTFAGINKSEYNEDVCKPKEEAI